MWGSVDQQLWTLAGKCQVKRNSSSVLNATIRKKTAIGIWRKLSNREFKQNFIMWKVYHSCGRRDTHTKYLDHYYSVYLCVHGWMCVCALSPLQVFKCTFYGQKGMLMSCSITLHCSLRQSLSLKVELSWQPTSPLTLLPHLLSYWGYSCIYSHTRDFT